MLIQHVFLKIYRLKLVFHQSVNPLSKYFIYSFWSLWCILIISALIGLVGLPLFNQLPFLWNYSFIVGSLTTMILAMYLPFLFIYKLHQSYKYLNKTNSSTEDTFILTVIRKCTILTIFSLISTWSVFIIIIMAVLIGYKYEIMIIWGYALILDTNSNVVGVILSNKFSEKYYVKICGWIDNCVGRSCFHPANDEKDVEL